MILAPRMAPTSTVTGLMDRFVGSEEWIINKDYLISTKCANRASYKNIANRMSASGYSLQELDAGCLPYAYLVIYMAYNPNNKKLLTQWVSSLIFGCGGWKPPSIDTAGIPISRANNQ